VSGGGLVGAGLDRPDLADLGVGAAKAFSLAGRVAVVTGALGPLGRRHCRALAEAGAHVVACDLDGEESWALADELPTACVGFGVDVTDPHSVRTMLELALLEFDRVDVLVNNAVVAGAVETPAPTAEGAKFEAYPLALWRESLEASATGAFLCAQIIGARMARQGGGSIINVVPGCGSVPGERAGACGSPACAAARGAVVALTRYLAAYWSEAKVRVNALSPASLEGGQGACFVLDCAADCALSPGAGPTDSGAAVVFLASDASSYVTGAHLLVDGVVMLRAVD
jgi:NAD(P)-dependent dehydrogenase (short-subunit alcohol dehydrogenase family)